MLTNFSVPGDPIPCPRMTQRDKWQKRDCVVRYREWADACRLEATGSPLKRVEATVLGLVAFFHFRVPESLSKSGKEERYGRMHNQKPDTDNLLKGLSDALLCDDKAVAVMQGFKSWCCEEEEPRTDVFLLVP